MPKNISLETKYGSSAISIIKIIYFNEVIKMKRLPFTVLNSELVQVKL